MPAICLTMQLMTPFRVFCLITVDISPILRFLFVQKVYYKKVDCHFPSDSVEQVGHIVGISEHMLISTKFLILTLLRVFIALSFARQHLPIPMCVPSCLVGSVQMSFILAMMIAPSTSPLPHLYSLSKSRRSHRTNIPMVKNLTVSIFEHVLSK
jgi:hypothetical protein